VGVGTLLGLLGNVLFYGQRVGLSFPLFVLAIIGVVLASSKPARRVPRVRNLWLLLPLGFFAFMIAIRADENILFLDVLAVMALGGLTLHYLPLDDFIDTEPLINHVRAVLEASLYLLPGPGAEIGDSWRWLRDRHLDDRQALVSIVRGLAFAVPVIVVFALLLGSADLVFANYLDRVWQVFTFQNVDDLFGRGLTTFVLGWAATGALAYGLARREVRPQLHPSTRTAIAGNEFQLIDDEEDETAAEAPKRRAKPLRLGMIEAGIILGSIDLLFGVFVLIQFTYFFGGQANIGDGLTFAEYARRGFFELVAVSVLTLGLVLFMDWVTVREGKRQGRVFQALAVVIIALTAVMLFSASQRMSLYETQFGFTHLRLYTHVFMVWLGVLFGFFLLALFRLRLHVFSLGVLIATIGYLGTLNLIDIDSYIAGHNIDRYHQGYELDTCYLGALSDDAVPALVGLYQTAPVASDVFRWAGWELNRRLRSLDRMHEAEGTSVFALNAGREGAWSLLDGLRDDLESHQESWGYESCNYRMRQ
jgi:hypothetical protein